ncbi:MAG: CopG family transcriptional regulator [Sphingomonadaceae bacterium]
MNDDVTIQLRLPPELVEGLRQEAIRSGTTIADQIRQAIANNQYFTSVMKSSEKELLIDEQGKLSRLGLPRSSA